jgi:hypothetical protein
MAPSQYGRVRRTGNSECDMSGLAGLRILVYMESSTGPVLYILNARTTPHCGK